MLSLLLSTAFAAEPAYPEQSVQTSLGEVVYWDVDVGTPKGPPVVLVHGLPTSKELWVDVVPELHDKRVIVVDLLEFGATRATDRSTLRHPDRAQGIWETLESLGIETIDLVAHDLGSSVAVDFMDLYGAHVRKLVLASSPVYPDFDEPGVVELVRTPVLGGLLTNLFPRRMYRMTLRIGLENDRQISHEQVSAFMRAYRCPPGKRRLLDNLAWGTPEDMFAAYPEILRGITQPTLLLQGEEDPWIPVEHAQRLDADIPNSELVMIPDGGHFLPLDTPVAVGEAVRDFLE